MKVKIFFKFCNQYIIYQRIFLAWHGTSKMEDFTDLEHRQGINVSQNQMAVKKKKKLSI